MKLMQEERVLLVEYGKKLVENNLTRGTGGNLSIYDRKNNLMAITPSGLGYYDVTPDDMVIMDLHGKVVEGIRKPSSEFEMHAIYYREREEINAVCHTHPIYSVTLSTLRWDLPAIDYLVAVAGDVKVRCSNYAPFGTKEIAEESFKATGNSRAVLLANHGLNTIGENMETAFSISVIIEMLAEVYLKGKSVGEPIILPDAEMLTMLEKFKTYGQK